MIKIIFYRAKTNKNFLPILFLFSLLFLLSVENLKVEPLQKIREEQALQHEVSVTLKLIQIYVMDKQGNPVMDLGKSDFELYDNNKLQPITAFEKHVIPSSPEKIEPPVTLPSAPQDVSDTMNRKFFLFFDFAFNSLGGIAMARKAALHFIDTQLTPTDEVGVLSYSTIKGLSLYEYLTTDHAKVREVIDQIGFKETLGRAGLFLKEVGGIEGARRIIKPIQGMAITQYRYELMRFSSVLKDFAKALRCIPGYKHIIFFSLGAPNLLMYHMAGQITPQENKMNINASDGLDCRLRYETMLKELETSNSPVLAVNVEGLSSRFSEQAFSESHPHIGGQIDPLRFIDRAGKGDSALKEMAKHTGGKYFGETNDYEKIAQDIQNLTSSYYVLGYKIDEKWDGKYHKIKINVLQPGCNVYYQKGYFNPKPFAQYTDLEKKLHLIDLALTESPYFEDSIHFPLRALASPMKKRSNLILIAEIPIGKVQEVSTEKMETFTLVFDEKKNIVTQQRTEIDPSSLSRDMIYFYSISHLPSGAYDCRVVMRNLKTGQGAVASSSIVIPERFDEGFRLYSPLVLIPGKKGIYLNGSSTEKEHDKPFSLVDFYPIDLDQYTPLVSETSQETAKLLILLPSSIIRFERTTVLLSAHLLNLSSGERKILPLSILGQQQEDDIINYTLELITENLMPGKYSLYIFAEDSETQQPFTYVTCPLDVK